MKEVIMNTLVILNVCHFSGDKIAIFIMLLTYLRMWHSQIPRMSGPWVTC